MHRKRALVSLALILVFSGGAFFALPQKASAVVSCIPAITPVPDIPVSVPTQSVGAAIRQNISNTFQASNFTKECILDALVTFLKEALIQNLTGSIVDWINNDFEGGPAFVTDPAGFFVNIADETAGHFIETQLGPIGQLLCSPFDLQLRLNLWLSTSASRKQYIGCRLSEIEQNVTSAFTHGDFIASGGWRTFHAVSADPRNNQYGAFILASDALNTEFIKKTNERLRELSEGRGFLSYKKCTEWSEGPNEGTGEDSAKVCLKYKVETPGSLINEQLNNTFSSELRKFELADEINEIFQALVNAGLRKVFAKGGGLRSVGARQEINKPRIIADSFEDVQKKAQGDARTNNAFNQGYGASKTTDQTLVRVGTTAEGTEGAIRTTAPGAGEENLARNKTARQSSDWREELGGSRSIFLHEAKLALDGGTNSWYAAAITNPDGGRAWWEVDLATTTAHIGRVEIHQDSERPFNGCLIVSRQPLGDGAVSCTRAASDTAVKVPIAMDKQTRRPVVIDHINTIGRFVRVQSETNDSLILLEVEVFSQPSLSASGSGLGQDITIEGVQPSTQLRRGDPYVNTITLSARGEFQNLSLAIAFKRQGGGAIPWSHVFSEFSLVGQGLFSGTRAVDIRTHEHIINQIRLEQNNAVTLAYSGDIKGGTGSDWRTPQASSGRYEVVTEIRDSNGTVLARLVSPFEILP